MINETILLSHQERFANECESAGGNPELCWGMHAAGFAAGGALSLFTAPTHTGKSTLSAFLAEQGYGYLTDDRVVIDMETLSALPCVTPLLMRQGGVELLRGEYGLALADLREAPEDCICGPEPKYRYCPNNVVKAALPIGAVYFLERGETNELRRVEPIQAIPELARGALMPTPLTAAYLCWLRRFSVQIPCYRLRFRSLWFLLSVMAG